ncbi:MAG: hypothetical protein HKN87_21485 [Saprospiraceae bacterium]|nr:hypothetical protein [Saprospiraceae bacterium]
MISDDLILNLVAAFFGLFGLFHFLFGRHMERYAVDGGLLNSYVAIRMSGALLLVGSAALLIEKYQTYGFYAISIFLILSAVIMHKFWDKETLEEQIKELLHFSKNLLLAAFVWYLKDQF